MTNTPPLVGLLGRKRSGKDSFAAILIDEFGFERVSFADPLRAAALRLDPIVGRPAYRGDLAPARDVRLSEIVDELGWEAAKDLVPEVRAVLQRLGTDVVRALSPDLWVDAAMEEVDYLRARDVSRWLVEGPAGVPTPVVITDVRFPNEADAIRTRGGVLLRLWRPGEAGGDGHSSETALDKYDEDVLVTNDGTLDELQEMARYFAKTMRH